MQQRGTSHTRSVGWAILLAVVGLLVGTRLGDLLGGHWASLDHAVAFGPTSLSLGALAVTVRLSANLVGLVFAAAGALVVALRR